MPRVDWRVAVVKAGQRQHPPYRRLVEIGIPLKVAADIERVCRGFTPKGLARKAHEVRN